MNRWWCSTRFSWRRRVCDRLDIGRLLLALPQGQLQAVGSLGLGEYAPTELQLEWTAETEPLRRLRGTARIVGDWHRLQLDYRVQAPQRADLSLELREPFGALSWDLQAQLPVLDLQALAPALGLMPLGPG